MYVHDHERGEEIIKSLKFGGRSLKMSLDDYDDASANSGHDPINRNGFGHGGGDLGDGGRGHGRGGRRGM
ncbi:hypothetical protein LIER_35553 [Lithospermum erythrorhizon]|uniref:Uncharacterized protein n=1 Tax=Lithospermum erythrorhizon TaxID=34254 RepID=A0AAV3NWA3_LITER